MKVSDAMKAVRDWWDMIPGWHERIIWYSAGAATVALLVLAV